MTKKTNIERVTKTVETKLKETMIRGVSAGFKAALNILIVKIKNGETAEQIENWAKQELENNKIIDKTL